jgi:TetR/AcrR family transcriptional regulator, transcriptional repressor for nem operon
MADSTTVNEHRKGSRRDGDEKRRRLIEGARVMLHEQGVEGTTIADIARASNVPVGNVYYHFKTKDELVEAAIEAHAQEARAALATLEQHRTPKARLKAFVRMIAGKGEEAARYGCPQGTLCSELDKRQDPVAGEAAPLMLIPIEWAERQFRAMGRRDARDLAVALIASYQGVSLLTNTLREPELMVKEARRLERWIDSLS